MSRLVAGQTLACEIRGPKSFDREVALCRLPNGTDIAAEMIRQGQAVEWIKFSRGFYSR